MEPKKYNEDFQLVHRYLCDDKEAGRELYANTHPVVENFVLKYAHKGNFDKHDVDDIVAEALKISIEKLRQYNGSCKFTTWVISITKNVMLAFSRKKYKTDSLDELPDIAFDQDISYYNQDPLKIVLRKETIDGIASALDSLSSEHKEVIRLRFVNKVPTKQIVTIFGESESAINSQNQR